MGPLSKYLEKEKVALKTDLLTAFIFESAQSCQTFLVSDKTNIPLNSLKYGNFDDHFGMCEQTAEVPFALPPGVCLLQRTMTFDHCLLSPQFTL